MRYFFHDMIEDMCPHAHGKRPVNSFPMVRPFPAVHSCGLHTGRGAAVG